MCTKLTKALLAPDISCDHKVSTRRAEKVSGEAVPCRGEVMLAASRAGFTLIELLVVLVILGMLAGLVGPQLMKYVGSSKTKTARLQIENLGAGVELFRLEVGRYPTTEEGLEALILQPQGLSEWNGPYLRKVVLPKDPWGSPYQYRFPGDHGPYDISSLGADNSEGGEGENQDIVSWE